MHLQSRQMKFLEVASTIRNSCGNQQMLHFCISKMEYKKLFVTLDYIWHCNIVSSKCCCWYTILQHSVQHFLCHIATVVCAPVALVFRTFFLLQFWGVTGPLDKLQVFEILFNIMLQIVVSMCVVVAVVAIATTTTTTAVNVVVILSMLLAIVVACCTRLLSSSFCQLSTSVTILGQIQTRNESKCHSDVPRTFIFISYFYCLLFLFWLHSPLLRSYCFFLIGSSFPIGSSSNPGRENVQVLTYFGTCQPLGKWD